MRRALWLVAALAAFTLYAGGRSNAACTPTGGFYRDSNGNLCTAQQGPAPGPTSTPGGIPQFNPVDAAGNAFAQANPFWVSIIGSIPTGANTIGSIGNSAFGISGSLPAGTNVIGGVTQSGLWTVAQGSAAASSASWPIFLYGLTGTNQADVDSSHRLLTIASQSGSPWGVSCTTTNCTTQLGNGATVISTVPSPGASSVPSPGPALNTASFAYTYAGGSWFPLKSVNQGQLAVTLESTVGTSMPIGSYGGNDNYTPNENSALVTNMPYLYDSANNAMHLARMEPYANGPAWSTSGGSATATVATGTGNTVIKNSKGRLARIVITTAGTTGNATCYDNATTNSGTVLAVVPGTTGNSSAAIGDIFLLDMPAANGITCANVTNGPAFTVAFF